MHGVDTILNILGSVCLLLWGVRMVRTGLTRAFGATLRRAIGACSRNRVSAFAGGIVLTGILQSSTATALLLASFAGRGLISLSIGLAVMLGANVGTTLTAQILSFPLGWVSPLMIARRRHRLPVEQFGPGAPSRPRRHRPRPDAAVAASAGSRRPAAALRPGLRRRAGRPAGRVCHGRPGRDAAPPGSSIPACRPCCWSCRLPRAASSTPSSAWRW